MRKLLAIVGITVATGCTLQHRHAPEPIPECGAVVFVADGAGDFRAASTAVHKVVTDDHWPVQVEPVPWSHGYLRVLRDQLDYAHGRAEGHRLAGQIIALKSQHPQMRIYLVGHSAGTVVAVAAAESLPPGLIEGMALLAPSLSTFYDLRPALEAVRNHVDVYYSRRDWGYLGIGTTILGTSDRLRAPASGRIGFQEYLGSTQERAESQKLRQHEWHIADWRTGNNGGHYGSYQRRFLRAQVLPALLESELLEPTH
jgi:pimeloyl-ACP methyl ester carboxylesterase